MAKYKIGNGNTYSKLDCNAGTFRRSKVNTVTSPKAPAANHSGIAAKKIPNNGSSYTNNSFDKKGEVKEFKKNHLSFLVARSSSGLPLPQGDHPQD